MADVSAQTGTTTPDQTDLFQILRDGRARTRSELASMTGLARSTVAARVESLVSLGLVRPVEDAASTGGRPSSQFAMNSLGRVVLAVDVGASHVRIAISDLNGVLLEEDSAEIEVADGPEAVLGWVVTAGITLLESTGRSTHDLLAIGVGLPGPVEHDTGMPIDPPIMPGWDRFDVPGLLTERFNAPVLVDNDVNIMALGEQQQSWPGADHLIFIKVATGIGAGVISAGTLQRGAQGIAGDIGHVYVSRGADVPCRCGNRGCLEALAAGPAIARTLAECGHDIHTSAEVVAQVRRGNIEAIQAVRQAGRDIGEVLTTCVSLMNPSVIVVGGSMAQAGEHLIAGVREVVYTRSMPLATRHLQIAQTRSGQDAALIGACTLAIQHALSPARVEALLAGTAKPELMV